MKTALKIIFSVMLLTAFSYVRIGPADIPITGQTFALALFPLINRKAAASLAAVGIYLLAGLAGLPVFAGGESGPDVFTSGSGGYLLAFAPAVAAGHTLYRRHHYLLCFFTVNALVLFLGAAVLAFRFGAGVAWREGFLPFIPGALIKTAAAYTVCYFKWRFGSRKGE